MSSHPNAAELPGAGATILVADDDDALRQILESVLTSEGYRVVALADGSAALEFLAEAADGKRARPDLLLLDFMMPELSGIGVLRVLRRFSSPPPAIIVTALADPSVETFAQKAGAARILHKPFGPDDLLSTVRSVLGAASAKVPRHKR
jgi:two-component system response regulator MprA